MTQSVEQIVKQYMDASKKVREKNRDPAKAADFLVRAGIAEKVRKSKSAPHGVRLAKRFR
jgi:hypothetical protein